MVKTFCFLALTGLVMWADAQGVVDEILQLYRIDQLPQYRVGMVEQFSSYDRTGKNDDGFKGTYSYIRKEGDAQVIAEMKGPGVINRIYWAANSYQDTIQFFFDNENEPRIYMPFYNLFAGNQFPFLNPVCGHEVGGYYCYLPIPYEKSCKVVFLGKMNFYQLQFRTYPEDTNIRTFSMIWNEREKEALYHGVRTWKKVGTNYLHDVYEKLYTKDSTVELCPGETIKIFEMNRGGRIAGIEMTGIGTLDENENGLILKAKWDHEKEWAINAPVKDFFGYFFGEKSMCSLVAGVSGDTSYIYYPMPFRYHAVLELEYLKPEKPTTKKHRLGIRIYYNNKLQEKTEGKFYSFWKREVPRDGEPYEILRVTGKGHYVGTILRCQGSIAGSTGFFEGDDCAEADGKLRIHGTGSEEFFNGGWYAVPDQWDMAYSLPVNGCLGFSVPMSRTGGYRNYLSDKLSFRENFKLTIEHGPAGNMFPVDYSSVAFYYAEKAVRQEAPDANSSVYPHPEVIKFNGIFIPILAFTNGKITNSQKMEGKSVLILETLNDKPMLAKFELNVPDDGRYKLSSSYFRTPSSGEIRYMQRQNELTTWTSLKQDKETYVEKDDLGILHIKDGSGTVTIHLRGSGNSHFILDYLQLEKL